MIQQCDKFQKHQGNLSKSKFDQMYQNNIETTYQLSNE